ncbi:MAG: carbamoyltransferase HypF [Opitutaceae bacterium]|nr:carbamoyltransferase HypF [Opitutaceae bacterium]
MTSDPATIDLLLRVRGTVQGVGFRPFVHRIATRLGLRGWVCNDGQGVLIRVVGRVPTIEDFARAIRTERPPAARVTSIERRVPGADAPPAGSGFVIAASDLVGAEIATAVPGDLAICPDCRRELLDARDRRHRYPFINCTQCGPRYSIIEQLPYDRPRTTMRVFAMCPACRHEYEAPANRRFHAEPNACPVCGPRLALTDLNGTVLAENDGALAQTAAALRDGRIVAVKGLGGFHLMCDATNDQVVAKLRRRKHREEKPLAVMFRDLDALRSAADVPAAAAALLLSPAAPVVLVPRRAGTSLSPSLAPGNPWIGALLPYTPLHVLLLASFDRPVVATSANLSEEPLCIDEDEAGQRLAGIADLLLGHNRPIARPVDDSVVRLTTASQPLLLRRARGYAPAPLTLPALLPAPLLCVGAQMKNTVAVAAGDRLVLSPHLGDLENAATQRLFERTIGTLGALHGSRFAAVACDKHPDYSSTHYAARTGLPCIAVQHHLAHVLACLLEHGHPADGVLGIAWDGTGYGEDGTIWGGEFILLEKNRATRFARLRRFRLPGGEAAVRDSRRVALGLAHEIGPDAFADVAARSGFTDTETATFATMLERGINSPVCSSAGRLFDAVGALLGLGHRNSFEGQTPMAVEAAATPVLPATTESLPFLVRSAGGGVRLEIDWAPMFARLDSSGCARTPAELAAAFHRGLAAAMTEVARQAGVGTVVLTGGCFQNALLHDLASAQLTAAGFRVLTHCELPPNDGSIAAGQALGALWGLTTVES